MKIKLFFFVLTGLLFINYTAVFSQSTNPSRTKIGIEVTPEEFKNIVEKIVIKMKKNDKLKDSELIKIIRIDNTIEMNNLNDATKANRKFKALFDSIYPELIIKRLHLTLAVGMCYYSEKYKVYWGGYPDSNSLYNIVKSHHGN